MRIDYDKASGALYIKIREGEYSHTEDFSDKADVYLDVDSEGNVLGLEALSFKDLEQAIEERDGRLIVPDVLRKQEPAGSRRGRERERTGECLESGPSGGECSEANENRGVVVKMPTPLVPTTVERIRFLSGREANLPKATPRFLKWEGPFPHSTYGGKPILSLRGEPLYAEFVILRLLEAEGWEGVWVNHVNRGAFPTRWTPSPVKIFPPTELLDLMDRIYERNGKRSGAFDILAWKGDSVLFAEAKHGGKDALRPSQKDWVEAALDEGVPLESLLVVEWGFGSGGEETTQ